MDKFKFAIQFLPLLIALIKSVESALPEKGQGAIKLAMVKEILISMDASIETIWPVLELDASIETIWPVLESVIAAIVKALNLTHVFKN